MKLRWAGWLAAGMSLAACDLPQARLDIEAQGKGSTAPPPGSHVYEPGTTVKVSATAAPGASFSHWSGAAAGTANPVEVLVVDEHALTAHFTATASSGGAGGSSGGASSGGSSGGSSGSSGGGSSGSSSGSSGGGSSGSSSGSSGGGSSGSSGGARPSAGCGKTPTLKSSAGTPSYNTITSGGRTRQYLLRLPPGYDNTRPYRLILGFHGATGNATHVAPSYFGLYELSSGSTIFAAPDAVGGIWSSGPDVTLVDDMLAQLEAELCIDTTRIELEGFSQGGAMAFTLACARPNVFRAAVAHSAGGLAMPTRCEPIAYFSSLGQQESSQGQRMTSDFFARAAGCTVETLPRAPGGGHLCSDYKGCSAGHPVRWCPYDGGHTPSPTDSGQRTSWMPQEVWSFLSQL